MRKFRHDGDCYVWSHLICTCGLLHKLLPVDSPEKHYKDFWEEDGKQWTLFHWLLSTGKLDDFEEYYKNIKPVSDEDAEKLMELFEKRKEDK